MYISLINLNPSSVSFTTYEPYISLIDLTNKTITINKGINTSYQTVMPNTKISINREIETPPVNVTVKIT